MRFWDSSAIVPLLIQEKTTEKALEWYRQDAAVLVWCLSSTEVVSALQRRYRESAVTEDELTSARQRLHLLSQDWLEVSAIRVVRERAERLLAVHPLKAADSLQLGAALVATEERPRGTVFLTFDRNLERAAFKEGFRLP